MMDLDKIFAALLPQVKAVGRYQRDNFRTLGPGGGEEKAARDLVSHIDVESENRLKEELLALLPEAGFFGEETARSRKEYTWVVDPLDGTTNYLSGVDIWAVSIALMRDDQILLGLVHKPYTGETFWALRDKGAFRQGPNTTPVQKLDRVQPIPLQDALVGTGFPFRSPDTAESFFSAAREVLYRSRGIRRMGAAALDLCYVAAGYLQAFWEVDLQPYDAAAGLLILEETGCQICNFAGADYDPFHSRGLVVGAPGAGAELQEIIHSHYRKICD